MQDKHSTYFAIIPATKSFELIIKMLQCFLLCLDDTQLCSGIPLGGTQGSQPSLTKRNHFLIK